MSENSQDYAQKPQWNWMFMNSASGQEPFNSEMRTLPGCSAESRRSTFSHPCTDHGRNNYLLHSHFHFIYLSLSLGCKWEVWMCMLWDSVRKLASTSNWISVYSNWKGGIILLRSGHPPPPPTFTPPSPSPEWLIYPTPTYSQEEALLIPLQRNGLKTMVGKCDELIALF